MCATLAVCSAPGSSSIGTAAIVELRVMESRSHYSLVYRRHIAQYPFRVLPVCFYPCAQCKHGRVIGHGVRVCIMYVYVYQIFL